MRKARTQVEHQPITGSKGKATSIGRGNVSFSTMNKSRKRGWKRYRGQGK